MRKNIIINCLRCLWTCVCLLIIQVVNFQFYNLFEWFQLKKTMCDVRCASRHLPLPFFSFRMQQLSVPMSFIAAAVAVMTMPCMCLSTFLGRQTQKYLTESEREKTREDKKKKSKSFAYFDSHAILDTQSFWFWDDDAKKYNDSHTNEHINRDTHQTNDNNNHNGDEQSSRV